MTTLFWLLLLLVAYTYVLYPIVLIGLSAIVQALRDIVYIVGKHNRRVSDEEDYWPKVGIVFSAYNEEQCIAQRIDNLLALDYPQDKIKIYVGSDGSADATAEILSKIDDERLLFLDFKENRGKASVLNDLVARADEDLLVFTDANTNFEPDAVCKLVRHFNDEKVGAVCGELNLVDVETQENQDSAYWKYERLLKFNEARIGALLGANGAIYCIRKEGYEVLPADTIVDDFTVVLRISLKGHKVIYDPEAVATEEVAPTAQDEYKRRVRIGMGNYQAFARLPLALHPHHGLLAWTYFSHKVVRWFTPHCLVLALICNIYLALNSWFYTLILLLHIAMYALWLFNRGRELSSKLLQLWVFWVDMNFALGHGFWRFIMGSSRGSWERTKR